MKLTFEYSLPADQSVPSHSDGFAPAAYALTHVGTEKEAAALEQGAVAGTPILYLPTRPSSALLLDTTRRRVEDTRALRARSQVSDGY